ncbi:MAG: hypothetical protein AAF236_03415 [Verrucomicrobiota bacterium]
MNRGLVVLVTAVVTFALTTVFWGIVVGALYFWSEAGEPEFVVSIDAPTEVELGETFTLAIEVLNPTDGTLELGGIDIYDSFLDGFSVVSTDPPVSRSPMAIFGFETFETSETLDPKETHTFTLTLNPVKVGTWKGDFDICTPSEHFVTSVFTIVVIDE